MSTHPSLVRSIPFWLLIVGSLASTSVGAYLLIDKLGLMETALTEGTATGVEVYVGQIQAVLGAILIGAGLIGLALAATIGALRSVVRTPAPVVLEETEFDDQDDVALDDAELTTTEDVPASAR
ncbi:dinucleotide-utilizing enzyme [Microbacterium sp.]|uniref:dinucleotide-utilizing enzyme n=1 Tax=Microbacterium sp. TaxID=51671 RepID=UPI0037355B75